MPASRKLKSILNWLASAEGTGVMMVVLTAVIAFTGVIGIILVVQGGKDTARIRDAAERQAAAAQQFADTAVLINGNANDAVGRLGQQAKATQQSANTAGTAVRQSERFFDLQNRAWLVFAPGDITVNDIFQASKTGQAITVRSQIENIGTTPVVDGWVRLHWEPGESVPKRVSFSDHEKILRFKVGGHQSFPALSFIPIPSEFPWFGKLGVMSGWIVYKDALPSTGYHLTEFGGQLTTDVKLPPPGKPVPITTYWVTVQSMFCFDGACPDYKERIQDVMDFERKSALTSQ